MENVPSKDPFEIAQWAAGALRLYAEHWGSSTKQFQEQQSLVIEIVRAAAKRIESDNASDAVFLNAYADALLYRSSPPAKYSSPFV